MLFGTFGVRAEEVAAQESLAPGQRVALVTGSTSGLGHEVALRLAAMGMHVIVHGRDEERGRALVDEIREEGTGSARFYSADLASLESTHRFAEAILRDYDRLNVLVNNAGVGSIPDERVLTEDGHELRFQVNYLSHFLLTRLLLPRIRESAPARIVNVASSAQTPIDFDDVMIEEGFSGGRAYAQSKLAQIMHAFDLAEELAGTGVVVSSLHPATYMDTPMVQRAGVAPRSSVSEGADAVLRLITSAEIGGGGYYNGVTLSRANAQAYDERSRSSLRRMSERLTGLD